MGLFKQARSVNRVSNGYKTLAGIRDEREFHAEVEHFAEVSKTSLNEVMSIGVAAMQASDRQPKPNDVEQWPIVLKAVADQVVDGSLTFSNGTPINTTVSVEVAIKIAHAILEKHRTFWKKLGVQDQLQREYAIIHMMNDRTQKHDERMRQIEAWMETDFGGADVLVEKYVALVKSGELRFETTATS